jgi:hypothetical protein
MPLYSIPRRHPRLEASGPQPINWRRGMFRVWVLASAGWIMSWALYLLMQSLQGKFPGRDLFAAPVLLFGPPIALLIFGIATSWAFRGFEVDHHPEE